MSDNLAYFAYTQGRASALTALGVKTAAKDDKSKSSIKDYLPILLGTAGLAAGGIGGYKWLRKQRLSANPLLRKLQQEAGDKTFEVATHAPAGSMGKAIRRILYGAPDISSEVQAAGKAGKTLAREGVVLHHGSPYSQLPVEGAININAPSEGLTKALADKSSFGKIFKQVQEQAPSNVEYIPKTEDLRDVLKAFGGDYDKALAHLKEALPGGFLIKPTDESLGDVASFISESTPRDSDKLRMALQNPGGFILQEKLPIQSEYRVHTINGVPFTATHRRAPEGAFRSAWDSLTKKMGLGAGGFAHLPVSGEERDALLKFVEESNKPLAEHYAGAPVHQAFDVARLPDGSFRLIESNPTPGTFNNPAISRKLQEMVTGRMHQDKALLGAAGLGLGAGGLGYGAGTLAKGEPSEGSP